MPRTIVGAVAINYEIVGTGHDRIVFVAGTGLSGRAWRRQVEAFAPTYACLTYDLRGVGETTAPEQDFSVRTLADDLAGLVERLDFRPANFVGLSLGSAIIQELAIVRPDLVRSATLIGTWSSTAREHHIRRWFEARLMAVEEAPMEVFQAFSFWMWAPTTVDGPPERMVNLERELRDVSRPQSAADYARHFRADLSHETRDRLREITCPTLVLYGDEDLITLPAYNQVVASAIPHARCQVLSGVGHLSIFEAPNQIEGALRQFFTEVRGRT